MNRDRELQWKLYEDPKPWTKQEVFLYMKAIYRLVVQRWVASVPFPQGPKSLFVFMGPSCKLVTCSRL